jgi:hypothetical protein
MNLFLEKANGVDSDEAMVAMLFGEFAEAQLEQEGHPLAKARLALGMADTGTAIAELKSIAASSVSRYRYHAWNELKKLGVLPSRSLTKSLLGVVVEVGLPSGTDYVAVYADNTARYFNFSGKKVIWEAPNHDFDLEFQKLFQCSQSIVDLIGVWEGPRRPAPASGAVRLNFLTPSGLYFGEGSFEVLWKDPMAQPVLAQALAVMKKMIAVAAQ